MSWDSLSHEPDSQLMALPDLSDAVKTATANLASWLRDRCIFPDVEQDDDTIDMRWTGERGITAFTVHVNKTRTIAVYTDLRPGRRGYGVAVTSFDDLAALLRDPRIDFVLQKKPS